MQLNNPISNYGKFSNTKSNKKYSKNVILQKNAAVWLHFYDKFTSVDTGNIETLYNLSDEMIINYDPYSIRVNDNIVYKAEQLNEMTK